MMQHWIRIYGYKQVNQRQGILSNISYHRISKARWGYCNQYILCNSLFQCTELLTASKLPDQLWRRAFEHLVISDSVKGRKGNKTDFDQMGNTNKTLVFFGVFQNQPVLKVLKQLYHVHRILMTACFHNAVHHCHSTRGIFRIWKQEDLG